MVRATLLQLDEELAKSSLRTLSWILKEEQILVKQAREQRAIQTEGTA